MEKLRNVMALWARVVSLVFSCVWLAGCSDFVPKPLTPSQTLSEIEARTLTNAALRAFIQTNAPALATTWPPATWGLRRLSLAAFYYQQDMEVARAKLAAAEAAVHTAGARPNPTFSFAPTYSEPPLEFFTPWTLGFTLDVPIETAGKRGYRIAQARHLANAARLRLADVAWQVRSRVRGSLLELRAAELNEEFLSQQAAAQKQMVEIVEDRLQAGESSLTDLQLARVAAAQSALQLRDAQKQHEQARVHLVEALGVPVNALTNIALSFAAFDELPIQTNSAVLRREALLNRPDILGALSDYDASQAALRLEIARQYPDITLSPGYTWNQGVNNWSPPGVSLLLPVLNQNQGPIAEAEARRREAAANFTALQAHILGEVDAAFAGYRATLHKLQTAEALLADQRQRMLLAQDSLDAGASGRLELLQTQSELLAGELARANALAEAQQALGLLEDALRRPLDEAGKTEIPAALLKN
jgi:cobalt-zinc-cadmium efflux system outer membrane protein